MLIVNGVEFPTPSSYKVTRYNITNAERNSKGTMYIDLIAKKWKIEASWKVLSREQMATMIDAVEGSITYSVSFIDNKGETRSGTFYNGDRINDMQDYWNNVARWKDFSLSLIEV